MRRFFNEVDVLVVFKWSSDEERIIWLVLIGEKYLLLELSNYVDKFIKNVLEIVDGVGSVFIGGECCYVMWLWLNFKKMVVWNIIVLDVE